MTQSATLAARNEATQRLKLPKVTTLAKLAIGTAIRPSRDRPWTVAKGADGRDRKRNVERAHPQPPDPQSEPGTLATHSGKNSALMYVCLLCLTTAFSNRIHHIWYRPSFFYHSQVHWVLSLRGKI